MLPFANQSFNGSAGLTQGGWVFQAGEVRAAVMYNKAMIYGSSQWGAPQGQGPHGLGNGGQIYAQYSPPTGPLALECQMPTYDSAAASLAVAHFPSAGAWRVCAGTISSMGYGRVYVRDDATNSWQPTVAWVSPNGVQTEIRAMCSYTDSVTGQDLLFAGVDASQNQGGAIVAATLNASVPGSLVWGQPELDITTTNKGVVGAVQTFQVRVMSFCVGADASGKPCLYATVGMEVYQRIDGPNPTWHLVWTKPLQPSEQSQSGLRGMTKYGVNYLVFPEGTDWQVAQLKPGSGGMAETKLYGISDLSAALGAGYNAVYATGAYNWMTFVSVGTVSYGLIGLSINVGQYPPGTPVYSSGSATPALAQAYYLVLHSGRFTLKQIAAQANPTIANRFMVPDGQGNVVAGGPDFEMHTEPSDLGWIACDTAANAVAGA